MPYLKDQNDRYMRFELSNTFCMKLCSNCLRICLEILLTPKSFSIHLEALLENFFQGGSESRPVASTLNPLYQYQ